MTIRVSGGVITDQMLSGGLRFFKLSSASLGYFAHTTGNNATKIPGTGIGASNQRLLVNAQDESDYNGAGANGAFVAGTGYLGGILTNPASYDFATGPDRITQNSGTDFDTDGVFVGQKLVVVSADNGANNVTATVTVVAGAVVTIDQTLTPDSADANAVISVFDLLTLNDGTVITVDVAGTGSSQAPITQFTVAAGGIPLQTATTRTVSSETAGNSDFTLTPGTANEIDTGGLFIVSSGQAVPNSVADRIFREITTNATVVIINQIDDNNIHFACDDSGFGWDRPGGGDAAADMQTAIRALGVIGSGGVLSNNPPVPDDTTSGVSRDLNVGGVTLTETTPFELT